MLLIIFLLCVLPLIFILLKNLTKNKPILNHPPGPNGLPLIGNLHQFDPSKTHIYFYDLSKIYGPVLSLKLGRKSMVIIQSAKAAKEVLKTQDHNFSNKLQLFATQKLSYNGLDIAFTQYSDYSREMKKLSVVHLLSSKRVQSFAIIRQEEITRLLNKILDISNGFGIVNLSDLLMSFASSNICRMAFGKRCENDDDNDSSRKFHRLLKEIQEMFKAFFFSDYFPSIGFLDKLSGQTSKLDKLFKEFDEFYQQLIDDHLNQKIPKSNNQEDFIDVLLQLRKERSFSFELTLDHVKAVLMNIFVAGTDTSTAMVIWAMTELIKHPKTMKKVQEELRKSTKLNNGCVSEEDLATLEYFKAVVKETLRLHPATPLLGFREALHKTTIQGFDIMPKTIVALNVWAIGRDPQVWDNPEKFMPERFVGSSIDYKGQDFELIPFGAGRRMCPGLALGSLNFEVGLANLLYFFDWELPSGLKEDDIDTDTLPGITIHKKNPLCLVARSVMEREGTY